MSCFSLTSSNNLVSCVCAGKCCIIYSQCKIKTHIKPLYNLIKHHLGTISDTLGYITSAQVIACVISELKQPQWWSVHSLFARARGVERSLWGEGLGYVCRRAFKLFCKQELEIKHQSWSWCEGWGGGVGGH